MTLLAGPPPRDRRHGFTLVEVLVTMTIALIVSTLFVGFAVSSAKSLIQITNQTSLNDAAGMASITMVHRIRKSSSAAVTNSGNTLTLTFDDDSSTDSDSDGDFFNDNDHTEVFQFYDTDGVLSTLEDNGITYQNAAGVTPRNLISGVQKIGVADIFDLDSSNDRRVEINFEARLPSIGGPRQRIEIATSAYRLN